MTDIYKPTNPIFDPITEEANEDGGIYFKFCQGLCEQAIKKAKEMGIPLRQAQAAFLDSTGFPFARAISQNIRLIEEASTSMTKIVNDYQHSNEYQEAPKKEGPNCEGCKFAVFQDTGWSNYTVEGTDFLCSKKLHPDAPFDRWYGEDKRLEFAQNCTGFEAGDPVRMDVDCEGMDDLTDEEKVIYYSVFPKHHTLD